MAFIVPDYENCDLTTFHIRKDFSDRPGIISHYIDRSDIHALNYYIRLYMDTKVKIKRPDTPINIITNKIPEDYQPMH